MPKMGAETQKCLDVGCVYFFVRFLPPSPQDWSVSKKRKIVKISGIKFHETLIHNFSSYYMWTEMMRRLLSFLRE
jgi:hypothetical protein